MRLIDVIPVTRIPHTQTQILSYFFNSDLTPGSLVLIPLGKRKEMGVVLASRDIDKMQIKKADFSLRNITQVITKKPVLTSQQIELALFLGQYYFASPGLFIKMCLPKKLNQKLQLSSPNKTQDPKSQKLILAPTIVSAKKIATANKKSTLQHSDLTAKQKDEIWWKVKKGQAQMIIGTRSAAFLPFCNLKEIIIEDEKNSGHRSWDMFPYYESITVAKKLAEIFNCKLALKNFCHPDPANAGSGSKKDSSPLDKLETQNDNIKIIDMREELKAKNFYVFSFALEDAIKEALAQKKQVILFANRRGAANFILCRDCGHVINCPDCEVPMALHLINGQAQLFCHRCGHKDTPPGRCPKCHSLRIKTVGSGTQKIESEAQRFFPEAKIARLDSDLAPKPTQQQKTIESFKAKEIDILITTQIAFSWLAELASAKPNVVAILSADTLLHLPDFRSGERTFQTITTLRQLLDCHLDPAFAGSRSKKDYSSRQSGAHNDKSFIIQTYNPNNSAIKYAAQNDWPAFWQEEIETRQALSYPPFSQIVKLTFRHRDSKKVGQEAKILAAKLQQTNKDEKIEISSALPAFTPRERGKFVWNIILKFKLPPVVAPTPQLRGKNLNEFLHWRNSLLRYVPQNWEINIDPENLL